MPNVAPAMRKVPASIISGIVVTSTGFKESTPCIFNMLVPTPSIWAPISLSTSHTWTICGSIAALVIRVVPSARTAAITIFAVAPTDGISKWIRAPFSFFARAIIYPSSKTISAPSFSNPFK